MNYISSVLICSIIILSSTSCREEIIEPGNAAGNINAPVIENSNNYFSLIINASDLSTSYKSFTNFSFINNRTLLTITDVSGGSVRIVVKDKNGSSLYFSSSQTEVENDSRKISGSIPESVDFTFTNFTGKLKFSLSYSPYD